MTRGRPCREARRGIVSSALRWRSAAGEPAFGEVVAWGAGLEYWERIGLKNIAAHVKKLTDYAVERLSAISKVKLTGSPAERLAIVSVNVEGMKSKAVANALDQKGIAVRAGKLAAQPLLEVLGPARPYAPRSSFITRGRRSICWPMSSRDCSLCPYVTLASRRPGILGPHKHFDPDSGARAECVSISRWDLGGGGRAIRLSLSRKEHIMFPR